MNAVSPTPALEAPIQNLSAGDDFFMGPIRCTVTYETRFGGEPHYGFIFRDEFGQTHAGFMPVSFVLRFTGIPAKG